MWPHAGARRLTTRRTVAWILVLEVGDPDPQPGKKGEKSRGRSEMSVPMRVWGLPGQVNKFDSNRPLLTVWDCLTLLPHRVRSGTLRMMNMVE